MNSPEKRIIPIIELTRFPSVPFVILQDVLQFFQLSDFVAAIITFLDVYIEKKKQNHIFAITNQANIPWRNVEIADYPPLLM